MKKYLFILTFALLVSSETQAFSLPGKNSHEIEEWVKKHNFLSRWVVKTKSPGSRTFIAFKELENHWFIDVIFPFQPVNPDRDPYIATMDVLQLVKKEFIGKPDSIGIDTRPWKTISCKDVWNRTNKEAQSLLAKIYGPAISNDFKDSKLVYKGPTYEHPVYFDMPLTKLDEKFEGKQTPFEKVMVSDKNIEIYLGRRYSYERNISNNPYIDINPDSCSTLIIRSFAWGVEASEVFRYNFRIYQDWLKRAKDEPTK